MDTWTTGWNNVLTDLDSMAETLETIKLKSDPRGVVKPNVNANVNIPRRKVVSAPALKHFVKKFNDGDTNDVDMTS